MAVKSFEDEHLARLEAILSQLDLTLSQLRDALQGAGGKTLTDVEAAVSGLKGASGKDLTTLETDVEGILAQLDITLSSLRDALQGTGAKTLTDLEAAVSGLKGASGKDFTTLEADIEGILSQLDITLSQLRDALQGTGGKTLTDVETAVSSLKGASGKDFTTLEADVEDVATKLGNAAAWDHGYITVSTAGTPVQGPAVAVAPGKAVVLVYHPDNTGKIGIGKSSADALLPDNGGTGEPVILAGAGQAVTLYVDNLNKIWVDAAVSGEKVMWILEA